MKANDKSLDLIKENIKKLEQIFPEAISDGVVDFDMLKALMGGGILGDEKYGLNWFGKENALNNYYKTTTNTLRYDEANSDKNSNNIYIKADNLEALKLLQKSYFEKIKMIYIDPPYNTGKDFVYKDDFSDTLKAYKEQLSSITTNTNTDGRFHSNWLNMMYPRLRLAKNLLRDDGVIFISIDEFEFAQLKLLCDEIFGQGNFIENFIWIKNATKNNSTTTSTNHEYILAYAKNIEKVKEKVLFKVKKQGFDEVLQLVEECKESGLNIKETEVKIKEFYKNKNIDKGLKAYSYIDNEYKIFTSSDASAPTSTGMGAIYDIFHPITKKPCKIPSRGWAYTEETMQEHIKNGLILFGKDETKIPRFKRYLSTVENEIMTSIITDNTDGKKELQKLFGVAYFDNPKPTTLIKHFLQIIDKDDIILDFFSGSATTAHALMQLNAQDGGNRKYILIQIPEPTQAKSIAYQNGYKNICEIGLSRIKKSSEKIKQDYPNASFDNGVKIFYLDSSNLSIWDENNITQENLFTKLEKIKQDRNELDLVYEFILKQGYLLSSKIDYKNDKYFIKDDEKQMIICLKKSDFNELLEYKDSEIIIKDDLLDDDFKLNILKTIKNAKTF